MVLFLLACASSQAPVSSPPPAEAARRIPEPWPAVVERAGRRVVGIGDLHGDPIASREVLRLAGLIDAEDRWTGGDAVLVQTGDTTDRGPDSRGVIDLLRSLREPARAAGGEVVLLNGNHEVMNLQGDWRYVSPEDVAGFGGQAARREAFARDGDYGRFLADLPVVARVDDTVFTHGGVTDTFASLGVDGLNSLARQHYFDTPGPAGHPVHGGEGPTWYRGYVHAPEDEICPVLERALEALDARRMVVGHTTQRTGQALARCAGRLAVIDVGISAHYGGHLGAWELRGDDARMLHPTGPVDLPDPPGIATGAHGD